VCGTALKIHVSLQCKQLLDKLGGYQTEKRGLIYVKVSVILANFPQGPIRTDRQYKPDSLLLVSCLLLEYLLYGFTQK